MRTLCLGFSVAVSFFSTVVHSFVPTSTSSVLQSNAPLVSLFAELPKSSKRSAFGRKQIRYSPYELSNMSPEQRAKLSKENSRQLATTDPLLLKRDRALIALHSTLGMEMLDSMNLLEAFPQLYRDCPSLATRILYLTQELNIPSDKIKHLLSVHPSMMVRVLLDDPENNLSSTVQLLQTEFHLTPEDIVRRRLWQLDRMQLRPKLDQLQQDLQISADDVIAVVRRNPVILSSQKQPKQLKTTLSNTTTEERDKLADGNSGDLTTTDPLLLKRDRALVALHSTLRMEMLDAINLLEAFPQLYRDCPSLSTRILYLLQELNLSRQKTKHLLSVHPSMMVRVLLDDPENNLSSTVEFLQTELHLTPEEIMDRRLWQMDRMQLRSKLGWLRQDFQMTTDDLVAIVRKNPIILSSQKLSALQKRVSFIIEGPVGKGLGRILRRGISAEMVATREERDAIMMQRVKDLIIKFPDILAVDIRSTMEYLQLIGCDEIKLGKIAYRRPHLFTYDVDTVQQQVEFFVQNLGMNMNLPPLVTGKTVSDLVAIVPDVFTQSIPSNLEPKMNYFRNELGLDQSQMRTIFADRPQILALNLENNIIPKVDYLRAPITEGGAGVTSDGLRQLLVSCPQTLRESLTDRIQPRCQIALDIGRVIPDDMPPKFLMMRDKTWNQWIEAGFDGTGITPRRRLSTKTKPASPRATKKKTEGTAKVKTTKKAAKTKSNSNSKST